MLLTGLVLSIHTCSYCSGQKGLCCECQSHLRTCLLQGERSAPKEMTATHFKIVAAFTNQQWTPVPVLTHRHFHSDAPPQYIGKAKTHLLKNAEIPHSATSREIPTKLTNTTETFKITVQRSRTGRQKNHWFDWSSVSTCISYQRKSFSFIKADSHTAVGTASQEFISLDWLFRTSLLHFPICP